MSDKPHEVMIFTVEEVLLDIYDGELGSVDTEKATKAFGEWLFQHNAHYYTCKGSSSDVVMKAILASIQAGKRIVVVSNPHEADDNGRDDEAGHDY